MSVITYNELVDFAERGVIGPVNIDDINGSSIDVHLGPTILCEMPPQEGNEIISLHHKESLLFDRVDITGHHYVLAPNEFILAHTIETFNLPDDISAEFKLNSSGARIGLENALATWCDPHWHGSTLTLELKNLTRWHYLRLHHGCRIGQIIFHRGNPVPKERGYAVRGRYNNDTSVQTVKV